ncbi:unnamed protein product [Bursaphelenchus okinawaensis]|uniref:Tyrosine-protein kinase n=1 Tax=Bursaphelenchus okinawaensis TaxID=465554 RepID=A0A811KP38_9BILA|nr:unnamed protein product [Bursaphelenchus okinawaensis]CAG9107416.1 unnamed protein product [Bursaphelenchus okinawaensis]
MPQSRRSNRRRRADANSNRSRRASRTPRPKSNPNANSKLSRRAIPNQSRSASTERSRRASRTPSPNRRASPNKSRRASPDKSRRANLNQSRRASPNRSRRASQTPSPNRRASPGQSPTSDDNSSWSAIELEDPTLPNEDYYHGFLLREDVDEILKKDGDFLTRISAGPEEMSRKIVLSVVENKEKGKEGTLHFVMSPSPDDGTFYCHGNDESFPTVPELINALMQGPAGFTVHPSLRFVRFMVRLPWQLKHSDIELVKELKAGKFREVLEGKLKKDGTQTPVAIKVHKTQSWTSKQIEQVLNEARAMRLLKHPNVIRFHGLAALQDPILIVTELADAPLAIALRVKSLQVETKIAYCLQASYALEHLHSKGMLHRDIRAKSFLIVGGTLKLSTFRLAVTAKTHEMDENEDFPIRWYASEALRTGQYTSECDVFSWGVLCWEIFSDGSEPYADFTLEKAVEKITAEELLQFPASTPIFLVNMVIWYVWCSVERRLTMAKVSKTLESSKMVPMAKMAPDSSLKQAGLQDQGSVRKTKRNKRKMGQDALVAAAEPKMETMALKTETMAPTASGSNAELERQDQMSTREARQREGKMGPMVPPSKKLTVAPLTSETNIEPQRQDQSSTRRTKRSKRKVAKNVPVAPTAPKQESKESEEEASSEVSVEPQRLVPAGAKGRSSKEKVAQSVPTRSRSKQLVSPTKRSKSASQRLES